MNHGGPAGPVALVVAAVLAAAAVHCAVSAARGRVDGVPRGGLRRLADADHAVTGLAMVVMVAPGLVPGAAAVLHGPGPVVLLAALAVAWTAVAVRDLVDARAGAASVVAGAVGSTVPSGRGRETWPAAPGCGSGASRVCGSHPVHLVAVNAAMAVMLLPGAAGAASSGSVAASAGSTAGQTMAGMPGHGVTGVLGAGGAGPAGFVLVAGLALGLWFVVHAVRTLTAGTGTPARRAGQAVMSAATAGMLLLATA